MKRPFLAVATLFLSMSAAAVPLGGKELCQGKCASCHGLEGQGGRGPKLVGDAPANGRPNCLSGPCSGASTIMAKRSNPLYHTGKAPVSRPIGLQPQARLKSMQFSLTCGRCNSGRLSKVLSH